jgi:hypothetical protein
MTVESSQRQQVTTVVGAGRSGTSAMTRGLQALGIELGDNLKPPGRKNAKGFFEDRDILDLNYRLHDLVGLRRNGSSLHLVDDPMAFPGVDALRREAVETLHRRFGDQPVWGFKCIGVMRLLPFWEAVFDDLGADLRYVLAIRNPLNVADSRKKTDYFRGFQEKSDLEWLVHVVPFYTNVTRRPHVVVDYDRMMANPDRELRRIAHAHALPITDARERGIREFAGGFLSDSLRHNRTDDDALAEQRVNALTWRAYRYLRECARDSGEAPAQWEQIADALQMMAPALSHIDRLEDELRGHFFGLNSVLQTLKARATGVRPRRSADRAQAPGSGAKA